MKTMNQEKINVIQIMTKKALVKYEDRICYKCEQKAARKLGKTDHQPTKKKRVSDEVCFLNKTKMCSSVAYKTSTFLNTPIFCELFGIEGKIFDPNQSNVTLYNKQYYKYYYAINSCKICLSPLQHSA